MKYRFFMSYIPVMIIFGFLSIWLAKNYYGNPSVITYGINENDLSEYNSEQISDNNSDNPAVLSDMQYNGRNLKDNNLPYAIKVNKLQNVVTIYTLGKDGFYNIPVKAMICSVGEEGNTPEGVFALGDREKWLLLQGDVYGQYATKITGNILFHSVPYYTKDKADLEVDEYNKLGSSVSAGCVRLSVIDSKWIFDNCEQGTQVEIFQSEYAGPMGKPVAEAITMETEKWDPTDPDLDNPYMKKLPIILGASDREIDRYSDFDITAGISAVDEEGKDISDRIKITGQVDGDTCGTYPITYTIAGEKGNNTSATANIIIKDDISPIINVNQTVFAVTADDAGSSEHLLSLLRRNVTAIDGKDELSEDNIIVDFSEILEKRYGSCHVKYCAQDSEGNRSEVSVLMVDVDLELPTITLKNEFQGEINAAQAEDDEYLLSLVDVNDNSGSADVAVSKPLKYQIGEPYKVIYSARDSIGNVSTLYVAFQVK